MQPWSLPAYFPIQQKHAKTCMQYWCALSGKAQPRISLEVCCAMLAKCHQRSCHQKLWPAQDTSNNGRAGMEKSLKALRSQALKHLPLSLQWENVGCRLSYSSVRPRCGFHFSANLQRFGNLLRFSQHLASYWSLAHARSFLGLLSYPLTSHTYPCFKKGYKCMPDLTKMQFPPAQWG